MMLDALLEPAEFSSEELESFYIEALYCSLGASLLDSGRKKFDDLVKRLSGLTSVHDDRTLAGPGELPGNFGNRNKFVSFYLFVYLFLLLLLLALFFYRVFLFPAPELA